MKNPFRASTCAHYLRYWKRVNVDRIRFVTVAAFVVAISQSSLAAILHVNPGGTGGAFATIGSAVANAHPGDTIVVAPGTYHEDVTIGIPLSLTGAGSGQSIINAMALPNGIYIDGFDHRGLSNVAVTGFTVENAKFEGILVTNSSFVTISDNEVMHNNLVLNPEGCPGLPPFETSEGEDCGEGIHFIGVEQSKVTYNTSENNSGGILLTDETGATDHNLITGNLVQDNPLACGITLASHPPAAPVLSPPGVYSNVIANNYSNHNGLQVLGAGAGVGIFAPGPGNKAYANVVVNNTLTDNGLPGVTLHNHAAPTGAPPVNLNDNIIMENTIYGNAADTADAATPGPTGINIFGIAPITGTLIFGNVINEEAIDVATKTPGQVNVHLNSLLGGSIGVDNLGNGRVDAIENWWGSPDGPGAQGATKVSGAGKSLISFTFWLRNPVPELPAVATGTN